MFLSTTALLLRWLDIIYDGSSNQFEIIVIVSTIVQFIDDPVCITFRIIIFVFGLDQPFDASSSELSVYIYINDKTRERQYY